MPEMTNPEPPPGEEHNPDNLTAAQVGDGWRLLRKGEQLLPSDELRCCNGTWMSLSGSVSPIPMVPALTYRRRIQPPAPEQPIEAAKRIASEVIADIASGKDVLSELSPEPTEPAKVGSAEQRICSNCNGVGLVSNHPGIDEPCPGCFAHEGSCIICGELSTFAVWSGGAGACQKCRDARQERDDAIRDLGNAQQWIDSEPDWKSQYNAKLTAAEQRIAELERELWLARRESQNNADTSTAALETLRAQIAEAKRDGERIGALDSEHRGIVWRRTPAGFECSANGGASWHPNSRAAIDAASTQEGK